MRILICHGFLLKGTGSNQYVQSLARALCKLGHDVMIMCQEGDPDLDFVNVFLRDNGGCSCSEPVWEKETFFPGTCTVYKPFIGGLFPVYVLDEYEGFDEVRTFSDLSEEQLDFYMAANRSAVHRLIETFKPNVIQVNHAVMLPYIVRPAAEAAETGYYVTVHGSSIEFTIRRDERYLAYGINGLSGASGIVAPSRYSAELLTELFAGRVEGLKEKTVILPHGVDTTLFKPVGGPIVSAVGELLELVVRRSGDSASEALCDCRDDIEEADEINGWISAGIERINSAVPEWLPEPDLENRLNELAGSGDPFLIFTGKLLETKGVHCALTAMPLVLREYPLARLVVVGFGELRGLLLLMLEALDKGDVDRLIQLCNYGNRRYDLCPEPFSPVIDFIQVLSRERLLEEYMELCAENDLIHSIIFTGYLTQEEHSRLLPYAAAFLAPSLAPEAFGLVALEAMACGVVPVTPVHSGFQTSLEPLDEVWGDEAGLFKLGAGRNMIEEIAEAVCRLLGMDSGLLRSRGREMRHVVESEYSWETVAERMVSIFTA